MIHILVHDKNVTVGVAVIEGIGAEGLPLEAGKHFVCADEPQAFADAVVALLRDPARRLALGTAGRKLMVERYAWQQVAAEFGEKCQEAMV